jgi:tagatose-6-phosphate ketose/aldose isomerase
MSAGSGEMPVDTAAHPERRALADLLARPVAEQREQGYLHTAREIDQQPDTWLETARRLVAQHATLRQVLRAAEIGPGGAGLVLLTGSGSSLYVAECAAMPLQRALGAPVRAVSSGQILTHLDGCMPPDRPGLFVSFARSGDSPESAALVEEALTARPRCHHLIITCNAAGRLATVFAGRERVTRVVLDQRTCDRSLVMTSSFTNMVLAAHGLASLADPASYLARVDRVAAVAQTMLEHSATLADAARRPFRAAVCLGSGSRLGAAQEAALKLLEMTAGRVAASADTFLGLRHGPMSGVHDDTLVVCLLASDPITRAYELDVIRELNRKRLGSRLIVGDNVPAEVVRPDDLVVECPGLAAVGDEMATVTDGMVGQMLGLFRCLAMGLRPDAPSSGHVISRVVEAFALHSRYATQPDGDA